MKYRRILPILFLLLLSACSLFKAPPSFRGAVYGADLIPPDFSLPDTTGGTFTLSEHTGDVVLLYFGYTSCPDVCPQTLGTVRAALNQLDDASRERIQLVFISVDPRRDTLSIMEGYLKRFSAGYIGAAASEEELLTLEQGYGLFAEVEAPDENTGAYLVAHTSLVYVIDTRGKLRIGFTDGMNAEDMAHDLDILANE